MVVVDNLKVIMSPGETSTLTMMEENLQSDVLRIHPGGPVWILEVLKKVIGMWLAKNADLQVLSVLRDFDCNHRTIKLESPNVHSRTSAKPIGRDTESDWGATKLNHTLYLSHKPTSWHIQKAANKGLPQVSQHIHDINMEFNHKQRISSNKL